MKQSIYKREIVGDQVKFSGFFHLEKNGLVRIKESSDSEGKVNLTILSHDEDTVLLECYLEKAIADEWYQWKEDDDYDETPWWHDGIYDIDSIIFDDSAGDDNDSNKITATRHERFHGKNRVYIELESGNYIITVPSTAIVEVDLKSGSICDMKHKNKIQYLRRKVIYQYGGTEITGTYPFKENGLIRINQTKETNKTSLLTILSHHKQCIEIIATTENFTITNWNVHTPWITNGNVDNQKCKIKYKDQTITATQYEIFNSDNRIDIELQEPGNYTVIVPFDACVETNLLNTDVYYKSRRITDLSVNCKNVNKFGHSGFTSGNNTCWSYIDYGLMGDPITKIKTKGSVILE